MQSSSYLTGNARMERAILRSTFESKRERLLELYHIIRSNYVQGGKLSELRYKDGESAGEFFSEFLITKQNYLDVRARLSSSPWGRRILRFEAESPVKGYIPLVNKAGFKSTLLSRDYEIEGTENRRGSLKRMRRVFRAQGLKFTNFLTLTTGDYDVNLSGLMRTYFNDLRWNLPKLLINWRSFGPRSTYDCIIQRMDYLWKKHSMDSDYGEDILTFDRFLEHVWPWIQNIEQHCSERASGLRLDFEYVWTVEVAGFPHVHCMLTKNIPFSLLALYWDYPVLRTEKIRDMRKIKNYLQSYMMKSGDELVEAIDYMLIRTVSKRTYFTSRGLGRQSSAWAYNPADSQEDSGDLTTLQAQRLSDLCHNVRRVSEIFRQDRGFDAVLSNDVRFQEMINEISLWDATNKMTYDEFIDYYEVGGLFQMLFGNALREHWETRSEINYYNLYRLHCNKLMLEDYFVDYAAEEDKKRYSKELTDGLERAKELHVLRDAMVRRNAIIKKDELQRRLEWATCSIKKPGSNYKPGEIKEMEREYLLLFDRIKEGIGKFNSELYISEIRSPEGKVYPKKRKLVSASL